MNDFIKLVQCIAIASLNDQISELESINFKEYDRQVSTVSEYLNNDLDFRENIEGLFPAISNFLGSEYSDQILKIQSDFFQKYEDKNTQRTNRMIELKNLRTERDNLIKIFNAEKLKNNSIDNIRVLHTKNINKYSKACSELLDASSEFENVSFTNQSSTYTNSCLQFSFLKGDDKDIELLLNKKTKYLKHTSSSLNEYYPKLKDSSYFSNVILFKDLLIDLKTVSLKDRIFK